MNELVRVKMLSMTMTSRYGTLSTGDELRTDAEYAKHLVEDCHAAEYIKPIEIAPAIEIAPPVGGEKHKPQLKK